MNRELCQRLQDVQQARPSIQLPARAWQADHEAVNCSDCNDLFSITTRKVRVWAGATEHFSVAAIDNALKWHGSARGTMGHSGKPCMGYPVRWLPRAASLLSCNGDICVDMYLIQCSRSRTYPYPQCTVTPWGPTASLPRLWVCSG